MKKFQFSLEKILTYKDQNLEYEMMNLRELYQGLSQVEDRLNELQSKYSDSVCEYEKAKISTTPSVYKLYLNYLELLTDEIEESECEKQEFLKRINDQIEVIKQLKTETRSLEIIRESRFDLYQKETIKKTEKEIEEFVSTARVIGNII